MSLPTCKKNLTIKDVLSIINMCGASGVSELKYGDLFLSFKKEKGSSEIPLSSYPQNQVDKIKFDAQLFAAEEIRTKEDELANIPKEKKTKQGYLKDGFVVDSSDTDEQISASETEDEDSSENDETDETEKEEDDIVLEDIGSELSEDSYDYDSDGVAK
jgi:hypothetical protein